VIHDRGTIKWTSLMMPEHMQILQEIDTKQNYKKKPKLDEQEKEEINNKIQLAVHNNLTIKVKYYAKHDFHIIIGKVVKIDVLDKYFQIQDIIINFKNVLDVQVD